MNACLQLGYIQSSLQWKICTNKTNAIIERSLFLQLRSVLLAITIAHEAIQIHRLHHRREAIGTLGIALARANVVGLFACDLGRIVWVLDVEDGLAGLDKLGKGLALLVLDTLLVDGKVDEADDVVDDVAGVLEADAHVVAGGFFVKELHEVDGVLGGETEAIVLVLLILLAWILAILS